MSERTLFAFLPLLFVGGLGAGGCAPSATLTYRQLGACDDFAPGLLMSGPNKAYVFFRLDSVDNTASNTPVTVDPFQLNVPSLATVPGEGVIDKNLTTMWALALQGPPATVFTVPAKTSQAVIGWGVMLVPTSTSDGAVEANTTSYFLDAAAGSGILPVKEASSQTSWPNTRDCGSINFAAQGG